MKVQLAKSLLSSAIARVQGAITDRSLAQIGLKADSSRLMVQATDRVLAIYSGLDAEVSSSGTVFVPARLFTDVVKELPDGTVTLEQDGANVVITAGSQEEFTMKLPLIEELSWRSPPEIVTSNATDLPAEKLAYLIDQVNFCIVHDSPRNYGSVGYLHKPSDQSCRLVGTDGFRLSYCEVDVSMPEGFLSEGVCLSKRGLSELSKMCGEGYEFLNLSISEDQTTLLAKVPDYEIYVRLSAVKYPNYMGVLPEDQPGSGLLIARSYLQSVVKRVMLASDRSRALLLSFSSSSLTLTSKTMGSSESREKVSLPDYQGPKFDIAVNGKFLTDVFTTTSCDNLTLQFNSSSNEDPIVIVPRSEPSDCRSKHVLVPIKQNDS